MIRRLASGGGLHAPDAEGRAGLRIADRAVDPAVLALVDEDTARPPEAFASAVALDWDDTLLPTLAAIDGDVLVDVNGLAGRAGAARLAAVPGKARVGVFASRPEAVSVGLSSPAIRRRIVAPLIWRAWFSHFRLWANPSEGEPTLHLLVQSAQSRLAAALRRGLVRAAPDARIRTISADPQAEDSAAAFVDGRTPLGPRPLLVIDFSGRADGFAFLREIYERLQIPILDERERAAWAVAGAERPAPALSRVLALALDALGPRERYDVLTAAANARAVSGYAEDAGWATIWRVLEASAQRKRILSP